MKTLQKSEGDKDDPPYRVLTLGNTGNCRAKALEQGKSNLTQKEISLHMEGMSVKELRGTYAVTYDGRWITRAGRR